MFIGHYALGFAAKKAAPSVSLGTLFLACQLADLVWPTLVLLGVEHVEVALGDTAVTPLRFVHYPYSHSLIALCAWGIALALVWRVRRASTVAALVVGGLVVSHWLLDWISHRPDMPVTLGGPERLGLGLWHSVLATVAVESLMFGAGVWLYWRATVPRDRTGTISMVMLVAFLAITYAANLLGPPPPSAAVVAWSAQALWLVVLWGYWVDRHRQGREQAPTLSARQP